MREQLTEGLAWLDDAGADEDYVPASSSISEAKERLGSEALRLLFERVAEYTIDDQMALRPRCSAWSPNLLDPQEASAEEQAGLYAGRRASEECFQQAKGQDPP